MTAKQRREYWRNMERARILLEKKYARKINRALDEQVSSFIGWYDSGNVDVELWNEQLLKVYRELYMDVYKSFAKATYDGLRKQSMKFITMGRNEIWTAEVLQYLQQHGLKMVTTITGNTRQMLLDIVNRTIQEGIDEGLGAQEVTARIVERLRDQAFTPTTYRAERIARTETVRAANMGHMAGARQLPFEVAKVWVSAKDNRTRRIPKDGQGRPSDFDHWVLDGQTIDLTAPFNQVGRNGQIVSVQQPGDASAPPGFTVNCRCRVAFEPKRDANGRLIMRGQQSQTLQAPVESRRRYTTNERFMEDGKEYYDVSRIDISPTDPYSGKNYNNVQKAKVAYEQLQELGINVESVAYSSTSWGNSFYMNADVKGAKIKIRSSDHSVTNYDRIVNEFHINEKGLSRNDYLTLERTMFPDRFIRNEIVDFIEEVVPKNMITADHEIVEERVSKRTGKPVFLVRRRRVNVEWVRKS